MIRLPRAILFDMDGTLTQPMLDFPKIKAEMGIAQRPILEALAEMTEAQRRVAEAVLHRHEEEAAANSTLNLGCKELLNWLDQHRIGVAVITRELGKFKPDPAPLLEACRRLGVATMDVWMVGDGQYDVEAGLAAGIATVWVSHGRIKPFAAEPQRVVHDLQELTRVLAGCLNR